jgi:hypothetical protein
MNKDYADLTKRISGNLRTLRRDIPEVMQGFSALAQAATRDGMLDKKTKELIALALGVAARCDGCVGFPLRGPGPAWCDAPGGRGNAWHGRLYGRRSVADVCGRRDRGL